MNHVWNLVKLDGEWYHVDVTWDDPVGGTAGKALHEYFLLSDKGILNRKNPHYGWKSLYECTSTKYENTAVEQAGSSYAYTDGKWYYLADSALYVTDSPAAAGTKVADIDGMKWYKWDSDSVYYTTLYSGILAAEGKIYVNTPESVLEFDPNTGKLYRVYSYTGSDGRIYGFMPYLGEDGVSGADYSSGKILLNIAKIPGKIEERIMVEISFAGTATTPRAGDVNGDGNVNLLDVTAMLQYIAKWTVRIDTTAADVLTDGRINLIDVTLTMKYIAGWDVQFPTVSTTV